VKYKNDNIFGEKLMKTVREVRIQSAIKYFNQYEGNGLSKPYNSEEEADRAAERYSTNLIGRLILNLDEVSK
jgi:hypothetical protein